MKNKLLITALSILLFGCSEENEIFSLFNYGYAAFEIYESPIDQSITHKLTLYLTDEEMNWVEEENCFYCPTCTTRMMITLIGDGPTVQSSEYYLDIGQGTPTATLYFVEEGVLSNLYSMYKGGITVVDQSPYFEVSVDATFHSYNEFGHLVESRIVTETLRTTFIILPTFGNALCDG